MFFSITLLAPSDRRPVREPRVVQPRRAAARSRVVLAASSSAGYDLGGQRDRVVGRDDDVAVRDRSTLHGHPAVHDRMGAVESLGLTSETDAPTPDNDAATSEAMGLTSEKLGPSPPSGAAGGAQELATALDTLREQVSGLAAAVPERAEPERVDAWLASFRRLEGAVAGLRTRLVTCVQVSRAHEGGGHAAPATYLKEALGVSGREAARQDKLARDLRGLPQTQQALTDGDIGPEQAQAIGRSARGGVLGDPDATETRLLPLARGRGVEDLSDEIRRLEQEADRKSLESAERRAYRRRRGTLVRRRDGMWDLQALLTDEDGEALATALDAFRTFDAPGTPIPEQRSPQQRTADAIADLVRTATRGGTAPSSGGVLPQLNVVVPLEALDPDGAAVGELAHGGVLSPGALERLLCDAKLRRLVTRGDSEVLDAGRSRQQWSVAQRQALRVRDGGCRGPGCDRPVAWTHAHHVVPWSKDGPTAVDNGLLLCSFHHHQVHEGGWTVTLDTTTAEAVFRSPTGRQITTRPDRRGGPRHAPTPPGPLRTEAGPSTTQPALSATQPALSTTEPALSTMQPGRSRAYPDGSSTDLGGSNRPSSSTVQNGAMPRDDTRRTPTEAAPSRTDVGHAAVAGPPARTPDARPAQWPESPVSAKATASSAAPPDVSPEGPSDESAARSAAAARPDALGLADIDAAAQASPEGSGSRASPTNPAPLTLDLKGTSREGRPATGPQRTGAARESAPGRAPP